MQHLSPHLMLSLRHWPKHPGRRSTARCCQHWEGWLPLICKAFGVFSLATPFPAVQLRSTGCSKLWSRQPHQPASAPCVLPSVLCILFFKRATTALSCKSTVRAHPPLTSFFAQVPSALVFPAFYSYYRPHSLQRRQLHKHW